MVAGKTASIGDLSSGADIPSSHSTIAASYVAVWAKAAHASRSHVVSDNTPPALSSPSTAG